MKKYILCLPVLICVLVIGVLFAACQGEKENLDDTPEGGTTSKEAVTEKNSGADSAETDKAPLNEMTQRECYETLVEYGFELPEEWKSTFGEFDIEYAKTCVDYIYSIGGDGKLYGYPAGTELGLRVYKAVCEYEGFEYPFEGFDHPYEYAGSFHQESDERSESKSSEKPPLNKMTVEECCETLLAYGFEPTWGEDGSEDYYQELVKECVDYVYSIEEEGSHYIFPPEVRFELRVYQTVCEYEGWEYPFESIELYEEPAEENWSEHPLCAMTEEECYQTLLDLGLKLPEEWEGSSKESILNFVKRIVNHVYRTGHGPLYSFDGSMKFAYRIVKIVCEYEGFEFPYDESYGYLDE